MRVVAGEFRGRRIAGPGRGDSVRPTADRVREALFSVLGALDDALVLDLFCGTGALGIEAVSRGAAEATLVDVRTELARRNVRELALEERCRVVRADALRFLRQPGTSFDLVLCDPPYSLADRFEAELNQLLPDRLAAGARVVVESRSDRPLRLTLPLERERPYGDTLICVYRSGGCKGSVGE
jgi:16S rRNA (guanine966-N2)-methyltransferase